MKDDPFEAFRAAIAPRYRLERELGRGGMATVYLAHELKHGRSVALKVLRPEIAAMLGSQRFLREIEVTAHLSHPNILPLYDSDEVGGRLFYVMPFVEGGTLKDRLARAPAPTLAEALSITRQVAEGLAYAHEFGVVHRDIKPANILLASGHVFIADFGIARAVGQVPYEDRMTATGLVLGTPAYMAPEQIAGASSVDGRADEYALACVLHEMLLGEPPPVVSAPNAVREALRSRHDVPPMVEEALERALIFDTSGRYPDVADFAAALQVPTGTRDRGTPAGPARLRPALYASLAVLVILAGILLWSGLTPRQETSLKVPPGPPDTTRYAILPMEYQGGITQSLNEEQLLHDALARWSGLSVVDHFQIRDALDRRGSGPLTSSAALGLARELGAGRFIRGDVTRFGDSLRVHAALYDALSSGTQLSEGTIRIAPSLAGAESLFTGLADRLLLRGVASAAGLGFIGTRSLPARQAYARGEQAIQAWDLAAADSAFVDASGQDPEFAQADLWLALVRAWSGAEPARWRYAAEHAAAGRARLSARDQAIASAILAQARGYLTTACPQWQDLASRGPDDFVAWYGLAVCEGGDEVVLRDGRSPSGWRFRTSYYSALKAYDRAFQLLPSIHRGLSGRSFLAVRQLFMTSGSNLRLGRAASPDTGSFAAYPNWKGDSLALEPYPFDQLQEAWARSTNVSQAVQHQRELFHGLATGWVAAFPHSAPALEALSVSLSMLGDPAALDTLRSARADADRPEEKLRLAGAEVWMRIRFSLPANPGGVRLARQLADSLLHAGPPRDGPDSLLFASLAALTGRATLAVSLSRHSAFSAEWNVAPALADVAPALLIYSAMGGPSDSLGVLESRGCDAIENSIPEAERAGERRAWLARAATLAFPEVRLRAIGELSGSGDYLLDGLAKLQSGDTAAVRRMLADLKRVRQSISPADRALDALHPEACLLVQLGDLSGAVAWLDSTLNALSAVAPGILEDPVPAGALVRAMALRAELAHRLGDRPGAAQWAGLTTTLWSDADGFLQPRVQEMRGYVP